MALQALLWDVDGTLAETERDGHRLAFNRAFAEAGVPLHWDAASYGCWLGVAGGRERITAALCQLEESPPDPQRVEALQASKQRHYAALMADGDLRLRAGVRELILQARAQGLRQVIVTTSGRSAVQALVDRLLPDCASAFSFWVCGEDVSRKKPDPQAYGLAADQLDLPRHQLLAIEDSPAGLAAAAGAGLACVITRSHYGLSTSLTAFAQARAVFSGLGTGARVLRGPACTAAGITLSYLEALL
ncbi:MAG: HAD-IA family hydrolase [Cyanobacteriota bacterium]|nr:HAD-IA family hydrolase [Cyanobacteriota bacterium]